MNNNFMGSSINIGNGLTTTCRPNFNGPEPGHCITHFTNARPEIADLSAAMNVPFGFSFGERFIPEIYAPLPCEINTHTEFKKDYDDFLNDVNALNKKLSDTRQEVETRLKETRELWKNFINDKHEAAIAFNTKHKLWRESRDNLHDYGLTLGHNDSILDDPGHDQIENFKIYVAFADSFFSGYWLPNRPLLIGRMEAKLKLAYLTEWGNENEAKIYQYIEELNHKLGEITAKENEISVTRQHNLELKVRVDTEELAAAREYQLQLKKHYEANASAREK